MVLLRCLVGALIVRRREFHVLLVCHLDSTPLHSRQAFQVRDFGICSQLQIKLQVSQGLITFPHYWSDHFHMLPPVTRAIWRCRGQAEECSRKEVMGSLWPLSGVEEEWRLSSRGAIGDGGGCIILLQRIS